MVVKSLQSRPMQNASIIIDELLEIADLYSLSLLHGLQRSVTCCVPTFNLSTTLKSDLKAIK